ncbi:MAG: myo-inosose-2 dehydratase [Oligoflexia bacterium]|nr:myo-inosose-2 dehydratase [Oligoflexia bacterium]
MNMLNVKIGAQPIIWSNDDFKDLGGQTPLETCLAEMREAGYRGTELGHKFPKNPSELKPILQTYGLALISGWHSTYLAENSLESEIESFKEHLNFLAAMGSRVVIVAECSRRIYADPAKALMFNFKDNDSMTDSEWKKVSQGLEHFAELAGEKDMKVAYHHHMGTVIQNLEQIDRLMETTKHLSLLGDTGHLAFAGENPLGVFKKYASRMSHVHLKNVRFGVVAQAQANGWSFEQAVREGVFTVPGDGGIDYEPIFEVLENAKYQGWLVVEAEQDPEKAKPFEFAKKGREYIYKKLKV